VPVNNLFWQFQRPDRKIIVSTWFF